MTTEIRKRTEKGGEGVRLGWWRGRWWRLLLSGLDGYVGGGGCEDEDEMKDDEETGFDEG